MLHDQQEDQKHPRLNSKGHTISARETLQSFARVRRYRQAESRKGHKMLIVGATAFLRRADRILASGEGEGRPHGIVSAKQTRLITSGEPSGGGSRIVQMSVKKNTIAAAEEEKVTANVMELGSEISEDVERVHA